jgi:hypothetical protein
MENLVTKNQIKLSQVMSEKLCHDLSGCAATIDNCVDLMTAGDENIAHQAKELLVQESFNLVRLIKFFRSIYGMGANEEIVSIDTLHKPIQNYLNSFPIKYYFSIAENVQEIPLQLQKVVNCVLSISAEKLSNQGFLDLYISENLNSIKITGRGPYFGYYKDRTINVDTNNLENLSVANVREYYINMILQEYGYMISYFDEHERFEYLISKVI